MSTYHIGMRLARRFNPKKLQRRFIYEFAIYHTINCNFRNDFIKRIIIMLFKKLKVFRRHTKDDCIAD